MTDTIQNPALEGFDSPPWMALGLCAQTDPEAFYPEKGGSNVEAKRVCATCDVREDCLEYALENGERFGIWGGLSERQLSQSEIGRRTGLSQASVSRLLGLLNLPLSERQSIKAGHRSANHAVGVAREQRQQERLRANNPAKGRPKGRKTTPYFSLAHPLAETAAAACDHRGTPKVGGIACGPCWESAIRADALAPAHSQQEAS